MNYKVNKVIEETYQAAGATTGLVDVTMEIYDETRAKDAINFPDITMTEIGATGRYYGSFTPDVEGEWRAVINSATKAGKVVRQYTVVAHDVDSVGDAVAVTDGKVDALNNISTAQVNTEVDTALAGYDAATGAEVAALNDITTVQVNAEVDTALADYDVAKASDIISPPMLG